MHLRRAVALFGILGLLWYPLPVGAQTASRLTREQYLALAASGRLVAARIDLPSQLDLERIASTGVVVRTLEPTYVIVSGDRARIDAVEALGFVLRTPSESDFKRRWVRVWVADRESYVRLESFLSPAIPESPVPSLPGLVHGFMSDLGITWAREAGFVVTLCRSEDFDCTPSR